jgi:hypothetical protein
VCTTIAIQKLAAKDRSRKRISNFERIVGNSELIRGLRPIPAVPKPIAPRSSRVASGAGSAQRLDGVLVTDLVKP